MKKLILFSTAIFSLIILPNCRQENEETFDKKDWVSYAYDAGGEHRTAMVRWLKNKNILIGKNREDVTEMFNIDKENKSYQSNPMQIDLEEVYKNNVHGIELLIITFNEKEKVEKVEIIEDWKNN